MGERVEQSGGHFGVAEHGRPLAEGQVGRDNDRRPLLEPADQMEEKLAAGLSEREIAEFVHDDEVEPGNEVGKPPLFAIVCFRLKPIDEIDDRRTGPVLRYGSVHGQARWTGWDFPVPVPPTRTILCCSSRNALVASWRTALH